MAISHNVKNFPTFGISKQLFYAPGAVMDGGFTVGGARISSPDVGGFGALMIQPSWQVHEWEYPISSWLMSQSSGQIFRVRLAPTPQVSHLAGAGPVNWDNDVPWSHGQPWAGDVSVQFSASSLEGTETVYADLSAYGEILRQGHVIGHRFDCYVIDDISYDAGVAAITIKPPLRRNITSGDDLFVRPWFTGQIDSSQDFRKTYDAADAGNIQVGMINLSEVIL